MKKFLCFILISAISLGLLGCTPETDKIEKPVSFYYCKDPIDFDSPDGVIAAEIRESVNYRSHAKLIDRYMRGPNSDTLVSYFPYDTKVINMSVSNNTVTVEVSEYLSKVTGIELTLACTCLAMTLMDLTNTDTVKISAENALLDGKEVITITKGSLLFQDDYIPATTAGE